MGALRIVKDDKEPEKNTKFDYKAELLKLVPDVDLVNDYITTRKATKGVATKTGLKMFVNECDRHNISYDKAMLIVVTKGWRGFEYNWLKDEDFIRFGIKKEQPKKEKQITMEEIKKTISEGEKIEETKKQINTCYQDYIDEEKKPEFCSLKFDFLVEQGLISVAENTLGYYNKKRYEAIEKLKLKYAPENAVTRDERNKFKDIYKLIESGASPTIDVLVKEMVLLEYFDKQFKDNKTKIFE